MSQPFVMVQDLVTALRAITDHTRPAFDVEILGALNFGYKEACRSIAAVRSEYFSCFTENFSLPANTREIDTTVLDPPLWRPTRLLVPGQSGGGTYMFRYRALHSQEYEAAELARYTGTFNTILYDLLNGTFPGVATTVAVAIPPVTATITVVDGTAFPPGTHVTMPVPAPPQMTTGSPVTPIPTGTSPYYGYVQARSGNVLTLYPSLGAAPVIPIGTPFTQLRRQVLRLANPVSTTLTGQLWYQYRPRNWTNFDQVVDPLVAEHRDLVLYYAISQYLRAVNDSEASAYLQKAQLLKSELMQDLDPLSGQNSEALDSALWGLG